MRRTETPKPIWIKFCTVVDIPDVVTYTNFGDHRLRGFWVAGGQISPSPVDFHRRPYNTLALPCERVMDTMPQTVNCVDVLPRTSRHLHRHLLWTSLEPGPQYRKIIIIAII